MDSQMAIQDVYMGPTERPAKRARYSRGLKRVGRRRAKKVQPTGYFKCMRWSSLNSTTNCHVELTGSLALPTGDGATTFSLSNVNGSGELVSLFDNFRLTKVQYRWVLLRDPNIGPAGAGQKGIFPRITWTHDFNDSTPIARALVYQRANMKEFFFSESRSASPWYTLNPAALMQAYEGVATTAYVPKWRQWLDTSDNATPHYGLKYNWSELYDGVSIRLEAKLTMEFKGIS